MTEKELEKYLTRRCKLFGFWALKLIILSIGGFPDRTLLMPSGRVAFCELKRDAKAKLRSNQVVMLKRLAGLGFSCYICCSKEQVDAMLKELYDAGKNKRDNEDG